MTWFKNKKEVETEAANPSLRPGGIDFETAAARVTVEDPEIAAAADSFIAATADDEALIVRSEWAIVAVKGCFYPAAKWIHPAYAIDGGEAAQVSPKMQLFLQMVADKYAPAAISRLANRYPEFWDLVAVLGVLYYQKWRAVSKIIAEEQRARHQGPENAKNVTVMPSPEQPVEEPEEKIVGQRLRDGSLVI